MYMTNSEFEKIISIINLYDDECINLAIIQRITDGIIDALYENRSKLVKEEPAGCTCCTDYNRCKKHDNLGYCSLFNN